MATQDLEAVGEVYARAFFELALEQGEMASVRAELEGIGEVLKAMPAYVTLLTNPVAAREKKIEQIERVFGGQVSRVTLNFLKVMTSKRRAGALPAAIRRYGVLADRHAGVARATVATAVELDARQREWVTGRLADTLGGEVACRFEQEKELLGGMVVTVGDRRLDASVRRRLERLGERLGKQAHGRLLDAKKVLQD